MNPPVERRSPDRRGVTNPLRWTGVGCRTVRRQLHLWRITPDRRSTVTAIVLLLVVGWLVLSPILQTGYFADDLHNSQRSAVLEATGESRMSYAMANTREWMINQGRFFPVSAIENTIIFDTIHERHLYKVLQVASGGVLVALLGTFAAVLTRRRRFGLLVGLLALSGLQLRFWYDPLHSFGLLLPSLAIKVLAALLLLLAGLRARGRAPAIAAFFTAGLLWTAGLLQYEIVYLLVPLPLFLAWHDQAADLWRRRTSVLAVLAPTLLLANYVATLRSAVATPAPAYTTNFALEQAIPTFAYQTIGAIPGSASLFAAGVPPTRQLLESPTWTALLGAVAAATAVWLLARQVHRPTPRSGVALIGIGVSIWLLPSVPISLSMRWQNELDWGYAYLPVIVQSLGFFLFLAGVAALAVQGCRTLVDGGILPTPPDWTADVGRLAASLLAGGVFFVVISGNQAVGDHLDGFRIQQETTDAAISGGLFDLAGEGSTVVASISPGGNEYLNAAYVAWGGGPADIVVRRDLPDESSPCGSFLLCDGEGRSLFHLQEVVTDEGVQFSLARIAGHTSNPSDPLIALDAAAIFGSAEHLPSCDGAEAVVTGAWAMSSCSGPPIAASLLAHWLADSTSTELRTDIGHLLEAAAAAGFFDRVGSGATLLANPGGHFSGAIVEWSGGPAGLTFTDALPHDVTACGEARFCTTNGLTTFALRLLEVDGAEPFLLLAPVAGVPSNDVDPLIVMGHTSLFGPGQATPVCDMEEAMSGSRTAATDDWVTRHCTGPPTALSTYETWLVHGCTDGLRGWFICTESAGHD